MSKSTSSLKINDKKWKELKRQIPKIKNAEVTVGIQSDAGSGEDGTPIAAYAFFNEVGTKRGIPERPFMRDTVDKQRGKWGKVADAAISSILAGTRTPEAGFSLLGTVAEADIKEAIVSGDWAPNAQSTIYRKGSSKPLIDTGAMRQAIRYKVNL